MRDIDAGLPYWDHRMPSWKDPARVWSSGRRETWRPDELAWYSAKDETAFLAYRTRCPHCTASYPPRAQWAVDADLRATAAAERVTAGWWQPCAWCPITMAIHGDPPGTTGQRQRSAAALRRQAQDGPPAAVRAYPGPRAGRAPGVAQAAWRAVLYPS